MEWVRPFGRGNPTWILRGRKPATITMFMNDLRLSWDAPSSRTQLQFYINFFVEVTTIDNHHQISPYLQPTSTDAAKNCRWETQALVFWPKKKAQNSNDVNDNHVVDGSEILREFASWYGERLSTMIYRVLVPSQVVPWDFRTINSREWL